MYCIFGVDKIVLQCGICLLESLTFLLQESISTCRFAQRVAMIKNDVLLNEEIDPKLVS